MRQTNGSASATASVPGPRRAAHRAASSAPKEAPRPEHAQARTRKPRAQRAVRRAGGGSDTGGRSRRRPAASGSTTRGVLGAARALAPPHRASPTRSATRDSASGATRPPGFKTRDLRRTPRAGRAIDVLHHLDRHRAIERGVSERRTASRSPAPARGPPHRAAPAAPTSAGRSRVDARDLAAQRASPVRTVRPAAAQVERRDRARCGRARRTSRKRRTIM